MKARRYHQLCGVLAVGLGLLGCATQRTFQPKILEPPRTGISLQRQLLCSVVDGRPVDEQERAPSNLQADLAAIYGESLRWIPYFSKTPDGHVAIKMKLQVASAQFGAQVISATPYTAAIDRLSVYATTPWGPIISSVRDSASFANTTVAAQGWWDGAAWIDVQIEDNRSGSTVSFVLPIVSERRESNLLGYASGDRAVTLAWQQVSRQLLDLIDRVFLKMVEEGY